jgi:hypothetical protein
VPRRGEVAGGVTESNVKVAEMTVLIFCDASHGPLQGMLGGGDGSVVTRFGVAAGFEDGDDNTRRGWTNTF